MGDKKDQDVDRDDMPDTSKPSHDPQGSKGGHATYQDDINDDTDFEAYNDEAGM